MLRHTFHRASVALTTRVTGRLARADHGQATAEYGLIILAAGGIALGVIAWASGTGSFTDMFESVVDKLTESL
jgi:Flp pilus assembly pilin Flp